MYSVDAAFLAAIATSQHVAFRATVLDASHNPLARIGIQAGEVRVDASNPVRRTMTLVAGNPDGTLNPDPAGLIWPTHPIGIEYGVFVDDAFVWVPLGIFYLDDPEDDYEAGGHVLTLQGSDRMKLAAGTTFEAPVTFAADERVRDVIRSNFELAGMGTDDDLYDLDDGGATLGIDHTYEADADILEANLAIAGDHALEMYVAPPSILTVRPTPDPAAQAAVTTYRRGRDVRMLSFRKRWGVRSVWKTIVIGESVDGSVVRAEAIDPHPPTPGRTVDIYRSAGITRQDQANAVAAARLQQLALVEEQLEVSAPVNPALEGHDVIAIAEAPTKTDGTFLLETFNVPLGLSSQTMQARRVRSLAP